MDNNSLIDNVQRRAVFYLDNKNRDIRVLNAMRRVDRKDFLPEYSKPLAYEDIPVPIGYGQTCSQPSMVAFMLDKLEIKPGNKILEIGAGCGYASAIASILCKPDGMVYAVEIIPELYEFARINLASFMENIVLLNTNGSKGLEDYKPFDRIFLSAGVGKNFNNKIFLEQLSDNGILLYPETYGNLYKFKKEKNKIYNEVFYGVSFVPLVE